MTALAVCLYVVNRSIAEIALQQSFEIPGELVQKGLHPSFPLSNCRCDCYVETYVAEPGLTLEWSETLPQDKAVDASKCSSDMPHNWGAIAVDSSSDNAQALSRCVVLGHKVQY